MFPSETIAEFTDRAMAEDYARHLASTTGRRVDVHDPVLVGHGYAVTVTMRTEAGPVCLDDWIGVLAEYEPTTRWNGWLGAPRFDAWTVEFVLGVTESMPDPSYRHEWEDDGTLVLVDISQDVEYVDKIAPNADGFYALGAYGWTWAEDEDPDHNVNDGRPTNG